MKLTPLILVASISTFALCPATAQDVAAEKTAASPADAAWEELATLLKGPKDRPKTREEAVEIFKKHQGQLDEKAAEFIKANPNDPRRWQLVLNRIQSARMRTMVGLPPLKDGEAQKLTAELLAAPDAEKKLKSTASITRLMDASDDEVTFRKLAEAHMKEFPDEPRNSQVETQIKRLDAEKDLKSKPLDIKFTATDGREVDFEKMRGKVVLVDFWAMWCGPCVAEIPNVVAAYEKLNSKGFEIVGISFDREGEQDKLAKFTADKKMPWPQHFDGKGWKNEFGVKYGINSIPRMWLVNKKGMVVDFNARQDLAGKVEKLLAE